MTQASVIIPTYNRKETLERAIKSILAQKGVSLELIVIDDGSTDGTPEWIQNHFPQVRLLQQKNQGPSAARNAGIQIAKSDWLTFLDSDDEWLPKKLKTQLEFHQNHPDILISQTEEIWIRNGKRVNPMKKHQKYGGWIFNECLPLCIISPSAVMIHRKVFNHAGLFDETYPACEDYELWLRITSQYEVGLINQALIRKYGGHSDQLSHHFEAMDQFRIQALVKILKNNSLTAAQKNAAKNELKIKSDIYFSGALKRGKQSETIPLKQQADALLLA